MSTFALSPRAASAYSRQFFMPTVAVNMRQPLIHHTAARSVRRRIARGFTLIEVMIVVAIVAILAAVAIPSYRDYILRGQLVDATTLLAGTRADMERYYQDNRRYTAVSAAITPPCARSQGNFDLTCSVLTNNTFTLLATGKDAAIGFQYSFDEQEVRRTLNTGASWPTPAPPNNRCWVLKRGQVCPP